MTNRISANLPIKPMMPTKADQDRSEHQSVRMGMLGQKFDETLMEWLEAHVDVERLNIWGIPDDSVNPIADMSRQLTTPGLYGVRPTIRHTESVTDVLVGNGGWMDRAHYFTLMQSVQYMVEGMGDYFVRLGSEGARMTTRVVAPQNIQIRTNPNEPTRAVELWELRLLWNPETDKWIWGWEQFILDGPEPIWRIVEADSSGGCGEDISNLFLKHPDGTFGALTGKQYPWFRKDGSPRLPYTTYHSSNDGSFWHYNEKRGAHTGTLNAALYSTYVGHCARDATGSMVLIAGLNPVNVDVPDGTGDVRTTKSRNLRTLQVTPGSLIYHTVEESTTPFVKEIGPGANLESIDTFARNYEMRVGLRFGVGAEAAQRTAANPASGISLFLNRENKREYSRRIEPIFRTSDLDAIELAAIIFENAGLGVVPQTGYTISYAEIPRSPQEEAERRSDLDWRVENGIISKAEQFQELNPGTTTEDANAALFNVAISNAQLNDGITKQLEADGLAIVTDADTTAFNDISLAIERLARVGDLNGVNSLRQAVATALGVPYSGDLTGLPGDDDTV